MRQRLEFVRTIAGVLGIDQANRPPFALDRFRMIGEFENKKIAQVLARFQVKLGRGFLQRGNDDIADDTFGSGNQMDAAHANEVRLDERERVFPKRASEIDNRVQPTEDRVKLIVARAPGVPQPLGFQFIKRDDLANVEILQIQFWHPLERTDERERDVVEIVELLGENAGGAQHHVDRFLLAVAKVDQLAARCFVRDLARERLEFFRRHTKEELPKSAVETDTAQAVFVRRCHWSDHGDPPGEGRRTEDEGRMPAFVFGRSSLVSILSHRDSSAKSVARYPR